MMPGVQSARDPVRFRIQRRPHFVHVSNWYDVTFQLTVSGVVAMLGDVINHVTILVSLSSSVCATNNAGGEVRDCKGKRSNGACVGVEEEGSDGAVDRRGR